MYQVFTPMIIDEIEHSQFTVLKTRTWTVPKNILDLIQQLFTMNIDLTECDIPTQKLNV